MLGLVRDHRDCEATESLNSHMLHCSFILALSSSRLRCHQAEVRVAREKGRRRGALAAKQEAELAAAQGEVAAIKAAAESAQRIANAAADDKKRLQVLIRTVRTEQKLFCSAPSYIRVYDSVEFDSPCSRINGLFCALASNDSPPTRERAHCSTERLRARRALLWLPQGEMEELQGKLADARQALEGNDQMIRWLNNQVRTRSWHRHLSAAMRHATPNTAVAHLALTDVSSSLLGHNCILSRLANAVQ